MAEPEADKSNIGQIKPPAEIPSNDLDEITRREEVHLKKAMSAALRAEREHEKHLENLSEQVKHHKDECEKERLQVAAIRELLDSERRESRRLSEECVRLNERGWAAGWMGIWASAMVVVGATFLAIAGCWPDLPNVPKYILVGAGAAFSICGLTLTVFSYKANNR